MRAQAQRDARRLRVRARRDVTAPLGGAYRSAFRGRGLAFEELVEYAPGDDAGGIEWKATARLGRPIVKRMREERDLVVALLVDVSRSLDWGHAGAPRLEAVRRVGAALAAAAVRAQDRVALATFADRVVRTVPPGRGPLALERVCDALAAAPPASRGTDARAVLVWATDTLPRHAVCILVSDLYLPDPGLALERCARKHDVAVLRVGDRADALPAGIAPVRVESAEGGAPGRLSARSAAGAPLAPERVRRRGALYAEIESGAGLIAGLRHVLESRTWRMA